MLSTPRSLATGRFETTGPDNVSARYVKLCIVKATLRPISPLVLETRLYSQYSAREITETRTKPLMLEINQLDEANSGELDRIVLFHGVEERCKDCWRVPKTGTRARS